MTKLNPDTTRIGWVGTGVMGASLCRHILGAGYSLTLHSRTRSKAEPLVEQGAVWADSPRTVAQGSDVVFTMVGFPAEVETVFWGNDGLIHGLTSGSVAVDMATSPPSLAERLARDLEQRNVRFLDAPVSGGDIGAQQGTLSIMVGGDRETFDALQPLWELMGKTTVHQGGPGAGQHAKLTNQIVIATNMIGVCEGLLYAYRAGLDLDTVMASIEHGAAGSWSLTNLGKRIMADNFDPGFFVDHFVKDLGIALEESRRMGLNFPGLALAQELYEATQREGHGSNGTHALHLALASLSKIDWQNRRST